MDGTKERPPEPHPLDGWLGRAIEHRYFICRGLSCETVWWRRYGGGREVEGRLLGLGIVLGWAFFTHDLYCLLYFGASVIGMAAYAMTTTRKQHSQWEGFSYLQSLGIGYRVAEFLEVFVVVGIGYLVAQVAPFLGILLLASAAGLWINLITDWWLRRKEVIAYHDAGIVMRNRRNAFRR